MSELPRRRTAMRDVAEHAGVAVSSVSRVISGHPDVSPEMRVRVMQAVEELGYFPDMLAQGLRSQKTYSVGFTVSDISNPVFAAAITGAERRLRSAGYSLLLTNSEGEPSLDVANIGLFKRRRADGLILSLADERNDEVRAALASTEAPIVLLDRDLPEGITASRVCFDHRSGMAAATQKLVELGHRRIGLITGGPSRPARERELGIRDVLGRFGSEATLVVLQGAFGVEHGERATLELLARTPRVTAIIAGGNVLMQGSLRALREQGRRVGDDVSFVGCDDVGVAELHDPQIAVVRRDLEAGGANAAQLLLDLLSGAENATDVILATEFVPRPSCAPVR